MADSLQPRATQRRSVLLCLIRSNQNSDVAIGLRGVAFTHEAGWTGSDGGVVSTERYCTCSQLYEAVHTLFTRMCEALGA